MNGSVIGLNYEDFVAVFPLLTVMLGVTALMVLDLFKLERNGWAFSLIAVATCLAAIAGSFPLRMFSGRALAGMVFNDPFTFLFYLIVLAGTVCTVLLNAGQLKAQRVRAKVDIDILVLLAALGAMAMVSSAHLIGLFLGIEILSVAVYVLAGSAHDEKASSEGALKYFLLGAFSSAFLLYGMVLVYGATGSMEYSQISRAIYGATRDNPLLLVGLALIIFGFAFKVSLVPFHFWAPDAYQGAPVSIVVFMAVVVKAAALGAFIRILGNVFPALSGVWVGVVSVLAGLTMTVGNIAALRQKSVKRMLAYSSIAHAGYILIGFVSSSVLGWEASVFYILVYSIMTVASFGVVLVVSAGTERQYLNDSIESFNGLGWRHPVLGIVMSIAILALAGMPPLAGFFGKLYLFKAALDGGFIGLTVLAALNSVISLYYYLSILVAMYFSKEESESRQPLSLRFGSQLALAAATVLIVITGVYSDRFLLFSREAVSQITIDARSQGRVIGYHGPAVVDSSSSVLR